MYVLVMLMANPPSVLPIVPIMQSQFLLRQEKTHYLFRDSGFLFGAGYRSRTGDLLITSQLLYQLS